MLNRNQNCFFLGQLVLVVNKNPTLRSIENSSRRSISTTIMVKFGLGSETANSRYLLRSDFESTVEYNNTATASEV
jgi:hypothetical protein